MATMTEVRERPKARTSDQAEKMALQFGKIGVIGAGQMGNGIAHVAALAGMDVLLNDISADRINAGLATINGNLTRQVSRKLISEEDRQGGARAHRAGRDARQARRLRSRHRVREPRRKRSSARSSPISART